MSEPRRFWIRTFGCQMNVHDTEKVGNLLHHAGYEAASDASAADLLIVNTCSIRAKAEHKLYSDLGLLREWKAAAPGRGQDPAGKGHRHGAGIRLLPPRAVPRAQKVGPRSPLAPLAGGDA